MSISDFQIIKQIGKGAFGIVYLVRRNKDKSIYALKQVQISKMNAKEKQNSLNEIRILASITNKNIISYKECFFDDKTQTLNLVMEYADDGDLIRRIQNHIKANLYFSENEIWFIFIQMVQGLKALHDMKVMHRDLKSANIFLMKNGLCKLGDMNVSKVAKMDLLHTQTGTPYYASPEVWSRQSYDYKSDIWSIGCIVYELCCLSLPFMGKRIEDVYSKVIQAKFKQIPRCYSEDLAEIIDLMLQVNAKNRLDCDSILAHPIVQKKLNVLGLVCKNNDCAELDKGNNKLIGTIHFKAISDLKKVLPKGKKYNSNNNKTIKGGNNNNSQNRPESSNSEKSKRQLILRSNSQINKRNDGNAHKIERVTLENNNTVSNTSRYNRSKTPYNKSNKRNKNSAANSNSKLSHVLIDTNIAIPINKHSSQCNKYNTPYKNQAQNYHSIQSTNQNSKCSNKKSSQTTSRKTQKEETKEGPNDRDELSRIIITKQNIDLNNIIEEKISISSSKIIERPKSCGIRNVPYHYIEPIKQLLINPIKIVERHNLKHFIPSHMQIKLNTMYIFQKKSVLTKRKSKESDKW